MVIPKTVDPGSKFATDHLAAHPEPVEEPPVQVCSLVEVHMDTYALLLCELTDAYIKSRY